MIGAEGEVASASPEPQVQSPKSEVQSVPVEVQDVPAPAIIAEAVAATPASNSENSLDSPNSGTSTEVVMPQMGESITEGTVSKWLKAVGDDIAKDEPLLEISTDKVDAEVPSPAAGKLLSINVEEGQTVEVGAVLALVGASGSAAPAASAPSVPAAVAGGEVKAVAAEPAAPVQVKAAAATSNGGDVTIDDLRRTKSSPLVRSIAKEHGIDITRIPGSGVSGRVTKQDIMSFLETGAALRPEDLLVKGAARVSTAAAKAAPSTYAPAPITTSAGDRVEKMSVMRKKISEHMTFSKQTSAHVTSVYEIDMTNVTKFRDKNKAAFAERYGTKLTYMPFIFQAVTNAIRKFPIVNSQVDGENIVYKGDINLGMAVALDWGLIVPVIRKADTLSLSGLALAANDLADRARTKKLNPDEVTGGTFTITNPGVFGGLYGTPIINQPQVAILCVGTIEKRPKVLTTPDGDDYIAIRSMAYFALTYDHRIVDGADAERFLAFMKEYLETAGFSL
jgi:2-oxoglutarate dehydrogenase E2 component (dihydrolipoamide succinyltransferase)